MQETSKTLKDLLEDNWTLTKHLHKKKIVFRRNEPRVLDTRFNRQNISIEITKIVRPVSKRVLARSMSKELLGINVWLLVKHTTEERVDDVSDDRQSIEDHIEAIIQDNQRIVGNSIRFVKVVNAIYPDNLTDDPPVLRAILTVMAQYEK